MRFPAATLRRGVAALMVVIALAAVPASAKVAHPQLIPSKSAYTVSLPDVPAFWNAWKANSIYGTFKQIITSPDLAEQMDLFNKFLQRYEAKLGFKLNGESMSKIFKSVDFYLVPTEGADKPVKGFLFDVSDKKKAQDLIDLIEKSAVSAATEPGDEQTSEPGEPSSKETTSPSGGADGTETTSPAAGQPSPVSSEQYKGVTVKQFTGNEGQEINYAFVENLLIVTNDRAEIKAAIDRLKGGAAAETYANFEGYKKADAGLGNATGELFFYANQDQILEMQKAQMSSLNLGELSEFFQKLKPVSFSATAVQIKPKDILAHGYAPLSKSSQGQSVFEKYPANKPLEILSYIPASTLISMAANVIDAQLYYQMLTKVLPTLTQSSDSDIESSLKQIESQLGFSVKNDLVPALGNEAAFMVNAIKMTGGTPSADLVLVVRVADKAKMNKVLTNLEKVISAKMGKAEASDDEKDKKGASAKPAGFKSVAAGQATVRYLDLGSFSPGYAMDGNYLLIGSTKEAMASAIDIKMGKGNGLLASEGLKSLMPPVTANANMFEYFNFTGIWDTAAMFINMVPQFQQATKIVDALRVFKTLGVSAAAKDNAIVSDMVLKLQ